MRQAFGALMKSCKHSKQAFGLYRLLDLRLLIWLLLVVRVVVETRAAAVALVDTAPDRLCMLAQVLRLRLVLVAQLKLMVPIP
jgi:hypothetical protein